MIKNANVSSLEPEFTEILLPKIDRIAQLWPSAAEVLRKVLDRTETNLDLRNQWMRSWRETPFSDWPKDLQDIVFETEKNFANSETCKISRRHSIQEIAKGIGLIGLGHFTMSGQVAETYACQFTNQAMLGLLEDIKAEVNNIAKANIKVLFQEIVDREIDKYTVEKASYTLPIFEDLGGLFLKSKGGHISISALPLVPKYSEVEVMQMFQKVEAYAEIFRLIETKFLNPENMNLNFQIDRFLRYLTTDTKSPRAKFICLYEYLSSEAINSDQRKEVLQDFPMKVVSFKSSSTKYALHRVMRRKYINHPDEFDAFLNDIQSRLDPKNPAKAYKSPMNFTVEQIREVHSCINLLFNKNLRLEFTNESRFRDRGILSEAVRSHYTSKGQENEDLHFDLFLKGLQDDSLGLQKTNPLKKCTSKEVINRQSIDSVLNDSVAARELKILSTQSLGAALLFATLLERVPDPDRRLEYLNIIRNKQKPPLELAKLIEVSAKTFTKRREGLGGVGTNFGFLYLEIFKDTQFYMFDSMSRLCKKVISNIDQNYIALKDLQTIANTLAKKMADPDVQNVLKRIELQCNTLKQRQAMLSNSSIINLTSFFSLYFTVIQAYIGYVNLDFLNRRKLPVKQATALINAAEELMFIAVQAESDSSR